MTQGNLTDYTCERTENPQNILSGLIFDDLRPKPYMELITEWVWPLPPKSGLVIANIIQKPHAVRPLTRYTYSIIFNVHIVPKLIR